jgi:hypothetical protein
LRSASFFLLLRSLLLLLAAAALAAACANGAPELQTFLDAGTPVTIEAGTEPPPTRDAGVIPPKPDAETADEAERPEVTSVSPNEGIVGSVGPTVIVSGKNFVPRTVVQLDGAALVTTYVSANELRATIPTSKLATTGALRVSAGTSPPGGGASAEVTFSVVNPKPTLTSVSPTSALLGAQSLTFTASGSGFVVGAKIVFDGLDLSTTRTNDTTLTATVPASKLQNAGSVFVVVVNPAPGGGASQSIAFTVANPTVTLSNVSPPVVVVGAPATTVSLTGAGFVPASSVTFNGAPVSSTFNSASSLTAIVPASALASAGSFPLVVTNPSPGGGVSTPVQLRVEYPAPTASALSPQSAVAGAGATDVTVTGTGFYPASQITFDGAPTATTYLDPTHLRATLTAAQLATAGALSVRVTNPTPGGGSSAALGFTIENPAPVVAAISPSFAPAGSADLVVTATGAGFVPSSILRANGTNLATTYLSPTQVRATVPAAMLVSPASIAMTVLTPAPGGGTSAGQTLSVGCDTSGVDVQLATLNAVTTLPTSFQGSNSRFSASGACPATLSASTQPFRAWVVQNTTGVPVTLSAWAVCGSVSGQEDDAFLTFYRRSAAPSTDAEKQVCSGVVSEGASGFGGYASPEPGLSTWCPGLTRANGGGLALGVCEKAVVYMQPYNNASTIYTPPQTIRLKPE